MDSSTASGSRLTAIQRELLEAFFGHERGFWLTGGAALAGFHLRHRATSDLDLFTLDPDAFERGIHLVPRLAADAHMQLEIVQEAPGFRRYALTGRDGGVVIDLVQEAVVQAIPDKEDHEGIRVDPAAEILANKLTALVGRAEERDLVDVMFLERAGHRVEEALTHALAKDGGCTPATLGWLLSQLRIPDDATLPADTSPAALRAFVDDLVGRLRRLAAPAAG